MLLVHRCEPVRLCSQVAWVGAGLIGHGCRDALEGLEYRKVARHPTAVFWLSVVPSLAAMAKQGALGPYPIPLARCDLWITRISGF